MSAPVLALDAPLGLLIATVREATLKASPTWRDQVRGKYDLLFGSRLDYCLWRLYYFRDGLPSPAISLVATDFAKIADLLANASDVEAWGAVMLLHRYLTTHPDRHSDNTQFNEFAESALCRTQNLEVLQKSRIGCEIVRFLAIEAFRRLSADEVETSLPTVRANMDRLIVALQRIDPAWMPGDMISLHSLEDEERLLPFGVTVAFGLLYRPITAMNIAAREIVHGANLDEATENLLTDVAGLARTAWRLSRIYRIRSKRKNVSVPTEDLIFGEVPPPDEEYLALVAAAWDALNAKETLSAAALAHLALRLGGNNEHTKTQANVWAKWIHQCGFVVDERFRHPRHGKRPLKMKPSSGEEHHRPYWARLDQEQKLDSEWHLIFDRHPQWGGVLGNQNSVNPILFIPLELLKCLAHEVEAGGIQDGELARAVFRITLRHNLVSLAKKCLMVLPDWESTLMFVRAVKKAQQTLPLGLDEDQHGEWLNAIKERFAVPGSGQECSVEDVLSIHEVLLGRSLAMMRHLSPEGARFLAAKFYDFVSERELRGLCNDEFVPLRRGPATINQQTFGCFAEEYARSSVGLALYVSMVALDKDWISILLTDGRTWVRDKIELPANGGVLDDLRDTADAWIAAPAPCIPWGSFAKFVKAVHELTHSFRPDPKTILLAVEADFAGIPWQDLFRRFWPGDQLPILSLIPSFTWANFAFPRRQWPPQDFLWLQSTGGDFTATKTSQYTPEQMADFQKLRFTIKDSWDDRAQRRWNGLLVIAAHGKAGKDGFPIVHVGFSTREGTQKWEIEREDWFEFGDYFTIVAHVCFSGTMKPAFLGGFGGVPGILLGVNTRLVCAPVFEMPPATATVLQRHLSDKNAPLYFSERYRAAIQEDPRVGLYNLFGFSAEFVEKPPR